MWKTVIYHYRISSNNLMRDYFLSGCVVSRFIDHIIIVDKFIDIELGEFNTVVALYMNRPIILGKKYPPPYAKSQVV